MDLLFERMRNSLKAALFVSAFSPALISVGAARLLSEGSNWHAIYYIVAGLLGCLSAVYIIYALKWYGESFPFIAKKIESYDAAVLGVVVTYIFPFIVKASDIFLHLILALSGFALAFFWFTDAILPSPLLRVLSYRFYKAEAANGVVYTLITNRNLLDPANVKRVKGISGSMLLEVAP